MERINDVKQTFICVQEKCLIAESKLRTKKENEMIKSKYHNIKFAVLLTSLNLWSSIIYICCYK